MRMYRRAPHFPLFASCVVQEEDRSCLWFETLDYIRREARLLKGDEDACRTLDKSWVAEIHPSIKSINRCTRLSQRSTHSFMSYLYPATRHFLNVLPAIGAASSGLFCCTWCPLFSSRMFTNSSTHSSYHFSARARLLCHWSQKKKYWSST